MGRKLYFSVDDESNDTIKRYEQFLSGTATGYFDVEELESIVEFYLRKGRTSDCSKALEFGFQLHPNSNALQSKRAKLYLATGEAKKAFRILEKMTETSDYEVVLLKIEVLAKMKRMSEALQLTYKLVDEEIDDLDNVCLDLAFIYLGVEDHAIALNLLEKGFVANKKNIDLLHELAFCYEQSEQVEKAIDVNNRIVDINPYADEAWFNLGQLYSTLQDFPKALEAYDFALVIDENDSLATVQKGHVHFQLNQFEQAIETYEDYKKMASFGWQTDIFIAECYEKLERYEEAITYYSQSLEAHQPNYDALTGIAICLLEQEMYYESKVYVDQAIELDPEAADAWVYLAEVYVGLDKTELALDAYLKSIGFDYDQPDTYMAIANIYLEKGDYDSALINYLIAIELDDTLEHVNMFIAVTYFKKGEITEAIPYLKKAVAENEQAASLFLELCPEAVDILLAD